MAAYWVEVKVPTSDNSWDWFQLGPQYASERAADRLLDGLKGCRVATRRRRSRAEVAAVSS